MLTGTLTSAKKIKYLTRVTFVSLPSEGGSSSESAVLARMICATSSSRMSSAAPAPTSPPSTMRLVKALKSWLLPRTKASSRKRCVLPASRQTRFSPRHSSVGTVRACAVERARAPVSAPKEGECAEGSAHAHEVDLRAIEPVSLVESNLPAKRLSSLGMLEICQGNVLYEFK